MASTTAAERRVVPESQPFQVFSTCPSSSQHGADYLDRLIEAAQWSERAGCTGSLIYTDNSLIDPWLAAHVLLQNTESLCPLVAVQPIYMHPYAVAKVVATLTHLYRRPVFLNMVAGGFRNDLVALGDATPHDRRYDRLTEYTNVIQRLLEGGPVSLEGEFYHVKNLVLQPSVAPEMRGGVLMSGSSEAGLSAAKATGAIGVVYPEPPGQNAAPPPGAGECGIRIGILTRPSDDEAWTLALERFPEDRKGRITRTVAALTTDSAWHKRLSEITDAQAGQRQTYWLHPFGNYHTNCPYLVGSYDAVAAEVAQYVALGYRTFILDIPAAEDEFLHVGEVFGRAASLAAASSAGAPGRLEASEIGIH